MTQPVDQTSVTVSIAIDFRLRDLLTNLSRVVSRSKDQLGRTIVARADVGYVGLVLDEDLSAAEVAQLQYACAGVEQ